MTIHRKEKRQTVEIALEVAQMLQLAHTGFKVAIINIFKGVKETLSKELKEGMIVISYETEDIKKKINYFLRRTKWKCFRCKVQ